MVDCSIPSFVTDNVIKRNMLCIVDRKDCDILLLVTEDIVTL